MTDIACACRYSLRATCAEREIRQRLIRALQTEWAYRQAFTTNAQRAAVLSPWLEHCNPERRHGALGRLPPNRRL